MSAGPSDSDVRGRTARQLLLVGILSPPTFVLVFLVLGVIKPGYSAVHQTISEGSLGQLGWIQSANFVVLGLALFTFSTALWNELGNRWSGRIGSVLVGLAGISIVGAGLFATDPLHATAETTHGIGHKVVGLIANASLALACFFFARRIWHNLAVAIYLIATGILIPIGIVTLGPSPWVGVSQRITTIVTLMWVAVLGVALYRSRLVVTATDGATN